MGLSAHRAKRTPDQEARALAADKGLAASQQLIEGALSEARNEAEESYWRRTLAALGRLREAMA